MIENDIMETLKQLHDLVVSVMQDGFKFFVQNEDRKIEYISKVSTCGWIDFLKAIGGDVRVL
mgnify:FL=1|jgi:Na+/phosphate symporter